MGRTGWGGDQICHQLIIYKSQAGRGASSIQLAVLTKRTESPAPERPGLAPTEHEWAQATAGYSQARVHSKGDGTGRTCAPRTLPQPFAQIGIVGWHLANIYIPQRHGSPRPH